ncbi:hypothetical protein C2R22_14605 [Salinigranum rubrum]|uniref:Glycosyl hydrolase n=1 Tax=Salinigranum rubrum TaxID=755307 RepID=A0A2I8VLB3_9EURY|nr:hypothetical protein [Salinigranum rubrum]AUV82723.1 hypothetical protein C2R22_14605 [Salinigranum rubrum]
MSRPHRADGFVAFFRRYVQTWVHALATAALTLFGTLTFVHRLFAVVAIAAYVLPPVALYLTRSGDLPEQSAADRPSDREGETPTSATSTTAAGSGSTPSGRSRADEDRTRTGDRGRSTGGDGRAQAQSRSDSGSSDATGSDSSDATGSGSSDATEPHWTTAATPVDDPLHDVVVGAGSYAVGDGGTVLADEGDGWRVALADGPGAASNALRGVDAVADGGVWFAGDGGAVGRLDPTTGRHVDHSAPAGDTTNLTGLAVAGTDGAETVLLADGSGRVRRGRWRDGETAWTEPVTPGSGSSLVGVVLVDESVGYVCDTNDAVFKTTDGGERFARVGPVGASGTLTDVAATTSTDPVVAADDGVLHRFDGTRWTPTRLDDDAVHAVALDARDGDERDGAGGGGDVDGVACGAGGRIYERSAGTSDWTPLATPATSPLSGVALDGVDAVAVGADGTVVERVTDSG